MVLHKHSNDLKSFSEFTKKHVSKSPSDEVHMRCDEKRDAYRKRSAIAEDPESMDNIISDPNSFPITVVPSSTAGGTGLLIRNSTQTSFGRISRISRISTSTYVQFSSSSQFCVQLE